MFVCFVMHYFVSIKLKRKKKLIVFQMYCYYNCSVALPHGAEGWSAACDCGIS